MISELLKAINDKDLERVQKEYQETLIKLKYTKTEITVQNVSMGDFGDYDVQEFHYFYELGGYKPLISFKLKNEDKLKEQDSTWNLLFCAIKLDTSCEILQFILEKEPKSLFFEDNCLNMKYEDITTSESAKKLFLDFLSPPPTFKEFYLEKIISVSGGQNVTASSVFKDKVYIFNYANIMVYDSSFNQLKIVEGDNGGNSGPSEIYKNSIIFGGYGSCIGILKNGETHENLCSLKNTNAFSSFSVSGDLIYIFDHHGSESEVFHLINKKIKKMKSTPQVAKSTCQKDVVIAGGIGEIQLWKLEKMVNKINIKYIVKAITSFGKNFVVGDEAGSIHLFSFENDKISHISSTDGFSEELISICLINETLIAVVYGKYVSILELQKNKLVEKFKTWINSETLTFVSFAFDKLIVGCSWNGRCYIYDFKP
jgi:hypothetical protein